MTLYDFVYLKTKLSDAVKHPASPLTMAFNPRPTVHNDRLWAIKSGGSDAVRVVVIRSDFPLWDAIDGCLHFPHSGTAELI